MLYSLEWIKAFPSLHFFFSFSRRASDSEISIRPFQEMRTPSRRIQDIYDLVHPHQKSLLNQGIHVFGGDTMTKVYAKEWELRKEGLREIQIYLKKIEGNKKKTEESINVLISVLSRSLRDKLYNVYSEALSLLEFTCTQFIPINGLYSYSSTLGDSVHETIMNKAGDAINDRRSASETMKSVKKILEGDGKVAKTFMNYFIKSKEREGTKAEKGRAKIIYEAAKDHNAPNNELGLSSLNVARFGAACLKSSDSEVRNIGRELFLRVYNIPSADKSRLRKLLPSEESHEGNSAIYKQLFSEMDGNSQSMNNPLQSENRRLSTSKSTKSVRIREDAKDGNDDADYDKMCMFCGRRNDSFTPSQLDIHYLTDCPMLTSCNHCNEVIEVTEMRNHLIEECRAKGLYKLCPTCKEPIERKEYHEHVGKKNCHPSPPHCARCILCGNEVSPSNDLGWRRHLMEECKRGRKKKKTKSQRTLHQLHFIPR